MSDLDYPWNTPQCRAIRPPPVRPVDIQQVIAVYLLKFNRTIMTSAKMDVMQGTLDLLVLKTLDALGPMHGWGLARRIEQVSDDALSLNQGTLYPALVRLQQRGWISAKWGTSDSNRRARFYALTKTGRRQLKTETENWKQMVDVLSRVLGQSTR